MRKRDSNPMRLADLPEAHDAANLAVLVRSAMLEPPADLPLVKWRICRTLRRQAEGRQRALRVGLVGALFFVTGGVVGAVVQPILLSRIGGQVERPGAPAEPAARARVPRGHGRLRPAAGPSPLEPEAAMAAPVLSDENVTRPPASAASTETRSTSTQEPTLALPPPPTPKAPAIERRPQWAWATPVARTPVPTRPRDELSMAAPAAPAPDEQDLLTKALQRLRIAREPMSTLAVLDEHAARFPHGVLAPEAARLRIEALLLLGYKGAALAELDRIPSESFPGTDSRRVLRGELRASAGRWRESLADFDAIISANQTGPHKMTDSKSRERLERALWARASVRSRLGDNAGARADLRDYLRLFPRGGFAAEAARMSSQER